MIGCEKLCGGCEGCYPLWFALGHAVHDEAFLRRLAASEDAPNNPDMCERWEACVAVLDPAALAELLAQALRGRDVEGVTGEGTDAEGGYVALTWPAGSYVCAVGKPMGPARAALSRLLAAGICGPEEALRLLEET